MLRDSDYHQVSTPPIFLYLKTLPLDSAVGGGLGMKQEKRGREVSRTTGSNQLLLFLCSSSFTLPLYHPFLADDDKWIYKWINNNLFAYQMNSRKTTFIISRDGTLNSCQKYLG